MIYTYIYLYIYEDRTLKYSLIFIFGYVCKSSNWGSSQHELKRWSSRPSSNHFFCAKHDFFSLKTFYKNVVFLETPAVTISRFRRKKNMMKIPRIFCFYFMIPMAAILSELRSGSLRHASSHSQRELVLRPCSAAGDVTELSSVMVMMVDNSDLIPINHHQPTIIYQVVSWWFMVDHGRLMVVSWWFSRDSTDLESLSARLRVQDLVGAQVWAKIGKTMKHMGYPLVI